MRTIVTEKWGKGKELPYGRFYVEKQPRHIYVSGLLFLKRTISYGGLAWTPTLRQSSSRFAMVCASSSAAGEDTSLPFSSLLGSVMHHLVIFDITDQDCITNLI
jgi:hypothetical protein